MKKFLPFFTPLLFTSAVEAQPASKSITTPEKITSVEGITEYRLANGLRVL